MEKAIANKIETVKLERDRLAVKIMENGPCDKLPAVLEGLLPYHTRERMHRIRSGGTRKVVTGEEANISPAA